MASIPFQPAAAPQGQMTSGNLPESLLVSLAPLSHDAFESTLAHLSEAFAGSTVLVATPDLPAGAADTFGTGLEPGANGDTEPSRESLSGQDLANRYSNLHLILEPPAIPPPGRAVDNLPPPSFLNAFKLAQQHNASACLLLGAEAQSLSPAALRAIATRGGRE